MKKFSTLLIAVLLAGSTLGQDWLAG